MSISSEASRKLLDVSIDSKPSADDAHLSEAIRAVEKLKQEALKETYSRLRNEREQATFSMLMRMDPAKLTAIRKEFFAREDSVNLDEFIYIIDKHLNKGDLGEEEKRRFVSNMCELFKDIDLNGDEDMEWSEFTTFTVEKANILNDRLKFSTIAHYYDATHKLDPSAEHRHRNNMAHVCPIKSMYHFAMLEDNKNAIYIFSSMNGKHIKTIVTEAVPQAIVHVESMGLLVSACADMTMVTHSLDDPNPNKRYQLKSAWATPGIQLSLAYVAVKDVLYSGGANGYIYAWDIKGRNLLASIAAHTDIVMDLLVLKKLNTLVSASLDTTIIIWDVYTHNAIMRLKGHTKGVFNLSYNAEYRLLFSCGFDHDVCVWSPFVGSMIYRLKGHRATLVGCQCVDESCEMITADAGGMFKLWDVRNFQCIQTFFSSTTTNGESTRANASLNTFYHVKLPSQTSMQLEDDYRIFAAAKTLYCFDQERIVHESTTDFSNVHWVAWNSESLTIVTASERNIIIWDALAGSKTITYVFLNSLC